MRLLAIDPGDVQSAYVLLDIDTRKPVEVGLVPNDEVLDLVMELTLGPVPEDDSTEMKAEITTVGIEMIASYGMPVGKEVFETCVWIGRFEQMVDIYGDHGLGNEVLVKKVYRRDVKLHHCHDSRAKDANVTGALIDRFASGEPNRGKGTKAEPGWFYGFKEDIWQAYAVGVYLADLDQGYQP